MVAYQAWMLARVLWTIEHDPGRTSMMQARLRAVDGLEIDQRWIPLSEVSPNLVRAVIAAEDRNFLYHHGIDWGAVRQAYADNRAEGKVLRGGSTITQQLAKNLYLSSWQSYVRKAQEAVLAYELEAFVGKQRILELYLNVIEWDEGVYGAEAAAQHYFGRSARQLTPSQAAYLAAIVPGPRNALNPEHNPRRHREARARILRSMRTIRAPNWG